jgi:hypothetical protein
MTPVRPGVDAAALPDHAFGHRGLIWWGTVGFMVIEGSMFVIALVTYFYLRLQSSEWPPSLPNPDIGPGLPESAPGCCRLPVGRCTPPISAPRRHAASTRLPISSWPASSCGFRPESS